jgi:hypothetical protein
VDDGGKYVFADQFGHAAGGGNITGGERREAGGVHVAYLTVKGNGLTISVNEENYPGGTFDAQTGEDRFHSLELLFLNYEGRLCHLLIPILFRK